MDDTGEGDFMLELEASDEDDNAEYDFSEAICICGIPSTASILECVNEDCNIKWFHETCVAPTNSTTSISTASISSSTTGEANWICQECKLRSSASQEKEILPEVEKRSNQAKSSVPSESMDDGAKDDRATGQKKQTAVPLGQLPVLEVDGQQISQSQAIFRYLARELGFYGANSLESAKVDTVVETLNDFIFQARKYFFEKDETKKAEVKKDLLEVQAPKYIKLLEGLLVANSGGDGFFVGSKVSMADVLVFYAFTDRFESLGIQVTEPKLKALLEKIKAIPEMADWLQKRPKTEF